MRHTTGYSSLDYRRNEDVLEELKVDPVENRSAHCKQKGEIISAGWKILYTQNNSLAVDLSKDEDLDDRYRDNWMDTVVRPKQLIYWP